MQYKRTISFISITPKVKPYVTLTATVRKRSKEEQTTSFKANILKSSNNTM